MLFSTKVETLCNFKEVKIKKLHNKTEIERGEKTESVTIFLKCEYYNLHWIYHIEEC